MPRRVLISGGGIAGMAAAYWLERGGAQVTLVERAQAFAPLGHYITLKSHGVNTVRAMGLLDACRAREVPIKALTARAPNGRVLRDLDLDMLTRSVSGMLLFRRADLHAALYEAVRARVDVRFGARPRAIRDAGAMVEVDLEYTTERVDLFVAADGVHSESRALLFGPTGVEELGGRYIAVSVDYPHGLAPGAIATYLGRGQFVGLLPRTDTEILALVYHGDGGLEPAGSDAASIREFLLRAYARFAPEVRRTFEALDERAFVFTDRIAMVTLPAITRGRCALLGDAAHCPTFMSGMGASLALQGAHALGRALYEHAVDVPAAVASYERAIRDVARGYQASAHKARHVLLDRNPLLTAARDATLRWTPNWVFGASARRFYQGSQTLV